MNRSILIVICDFLLVSLLLFSTPDPTKINQENAQRAVQTNLATNQVDSGKDLAAVMRLALDDEQKRRELLLGELAKTRDEEQKRRELLQGELAKTRDEEQKRRELLLGELARARETAGEREIRLQTFQRELQAKEEQARRAQQEQANLQQQFAAAQTNIQTLNQLVRASSAETVLSKDKLAALEAELRKRAAEAAALEQQLAQLAKTNQMVLSEKQQLAGQLQVAEVEKRHAAEQVVRMQEQVKVEREEKAKLAEGVKTLAARSGELTQEIRENRPLAANIIFNEFVTNRVQVRFNAFRSGLFDTNRRKETQTILVANGTNIYALCHVEETPLTFWNPGTDWERLTGTLGRAATQVPIRSLSFHLQDPRVAFIPVSAAEAGQIGGKIYRISSAPFKFPDAVLIGAGEAYYGECKFEIDLTAPQYLKLDRNMLKGLFGKFNPSRGDLVFSKTGELLGIMVNNTYCLKIQNFDETATFRFGQDQPNQRTGGVLSALYSVVAGFPSKLQ